MRALDDMSSRSDIEQLQELVLQLARRMPS